MKQPNPLAHYHRVDTCLWLSVARCLQRLVVSVLENPSAPDCSWLERSHVDNLLMFLDEMEFGYVHPRRTSFCRRISPYRREASLSVTANP